MSDENRLPPIQSFNLNNSRSTSRIPLPSISILPSINDVLSANIDHSNMRDTKDTNDPKDHPNINGNTMNNTKDHNMDREKNHYSHHDNNTILPTPVVTPKTATKQTPVNSAEATPTLSGIPLPPLPTRISNTPSRPFTLSPNTPTILVVGFELFMSALMKEMKSSPKLLTREKYDEIYLQLISEKEGHPVHNHSTSTDIPCSENHPHPHPHPPSSSSTSESTVPLTRETVEQQQQQRPRRNSIGSVTSSDSTSSIRDVKSSYTLLSRNYIPIPSTSSSSSHDLSAIDFSKFPVKQTYELHTLNRTGRLTTSKSLGIVVPVEDMYWILVIWYTDYVRRVKKRPGINFMFVRISHVYDVPFGAVRVFCNLSNGIETVFGKPGGNLHVEGDLNQLTAIIPPATPIYQYDPIFTSHPPSKNDDPLTWAFPVGGQFLQNGLPTPGATGLGLTLYYISPPSSQVTSSPSTPVVSSRKLPSSSDVTAEHGTHDLRSSLAYLNTPKPSKFPIVLKSGNESIVLCPFLCGDGGVDYIDLRFHLFTHHQQSNDPQDYQSDIQSQRLKNHYTLEKDVDLICAFCGTVYTNHKERVLCEQKCGRGIWSQQGPISRSTSTNYLSTSMGTGVGSMDSSGTATSNLLSSRSSGSLSLDHSETTSAMDSGQSFESMSPGSIEKKSRRRRSRPNIFSQSDSIPITSTTTEIESMGSTSNENLLMDDEKERSSIKQKLRTSSIMKPSRSDMNDVKPQKKRRKSFSSSTSTTGTTVASLSASAVNPFMKTNVSIPPSVSMRTGTHLPPISSLSVNEEIPFTPLQHPLEPVDDNMMMDWNNESHYDQDKEKSNTFQKSNVSSVLGLEDVSTVSMEESSFPISRFHDQSFVPSFTLSRSLPQSPSSKSNQALPSISSSSIPLISGNLVNIKTKGSIEGVSSLPSSPKRRSVFRYTTTSTTQDANQNIKLSEYEGDIRFSTRLRRSGISLPSSPKPNRFDDFSDRRRKRNRTDVLPPSSSTSASIPSPSLRPHLPTISSPVPSLPISTTTTMPSSIPPPYPYSSRSSTSPSPGSTSPSSVPFVPHPIPFKDRPDVTFSSVAVQTIEPWPSIPKPFKYPSQSSPSSLIPESATLNSSSTSSLSSSSSISTLHSTCSSSLTRNQLRLRQRLSLFQTTQQSQPSISSPSPSLPSLPPSTTAPAAITPTVDSSNHDAMGINMNTQSTPSIPNTLCTSSSSMLIPERVIDKRIMSTGKVWYLVRWSDGKESWESIGSNIQDWVPLLEEYEHYRDEI